MNIRIIKDNEDDMFKQWLIIANSLRINKLSNLEIDILSKLLYINHLYSHYSEDKRNQIIFNPNTKKRIRESLGGLGEQTFNNCMSKLRNKGLIKFDKIIITSPSIIEDKLQFNITLEVKKNDKANKSSDNS